MLKKVDREARVDCSKHAELIEGVKGIILRAGEKIVEIEHEARNQVQIKSDGSPVSAADFASNEIIEKGLRELTPDVPIVSEETYSSVKGKFELEGFPHDYWCVDPLDGTKEFIKGNGEYTVNIGLVCSNVPVLGVIAAPSKGTVYWGIKGKGAFRGVDGKNERIIRTRDSAEITAIVSRSHLNEETENFLKANGVTGYVRSGSAIKMCLVAEGAGDIYPRLGPTCYWDTAAGYAIIAQTGCRAVDLSGNDLVYDLKTGYKHQGFVVYAPDSINPAF